ncbi:ABC transporter permease [Nocardia higoensis]|uniref:ABC transporter permease n=1 Tax=Nocardia higoensis TaxID=228599 RepID=UPI0002DEF958|nr:ABC transporter permease [Nocardia higoensis]
MGGYIVKRVLQAAGVLLAAYTLSFVLLSALPGDAVNNRIQNPDAQIPPEAGRRMLEFYGLDRPIHEQFLHGLAGVFRGELGYSLTTGTPVTDMIGAVLPATLALTGLGLVIGTLLAAALAIAANYLPWSPLRTLVGTTPALLASVPTFVVGILALQFLSFEFGLIPSVDDGTFAALVAPAATLGLLIAAPMSQVFATSIRSTRQQPFVHVLHAKGAGHGYVFRKDVLRNSSLPVLTLLGLTLGELIAGSVVTESVFARDGIGQLTVGAVETQDLPVVQGVVLVSAAAYVLVNLAVDLVYPLIDPRVVADGKSLRVTGSRADRRAVRQRVSVVVAAVRDRVGRQTPVQRPVAAPAAPTLVSADDASAGSARNSRLSKSIGRAARPPAPQLPAEVAMP